jgi:general stress protein 26
MPSVEVSSNDVEVKHLLASAAKAVFGTHYCWLVTQGQDGDANARPMGRVRPNADEKNWIIRFVTDGRSRKVSEIRNSGMAKLIFQNDGDDAYALLSGNARLMEGRSADQTHWMDAYGKYFPGQEGHASVAFVEFVAQRMDIWIRGVTSEPFGLRSTVLERSQSGGWQVVPDAGTLA